MEIFKTRYRESSVDHKGDKGDPPSKSSYLIGFRMENGETSRSVCHFLAGQCEASVAASGGKARRDPWFASTWNLKVRMDCL